MPTEFLQSLSLYRNPLGAAVIATATITGVVLNILYKRKVEHWLKREKSASVASAIASELLYNSHNLTDIYLEIQHQNTKKYRFHEYKHIETQVYQELLNDIGELGSSLTFMVVDVYGDIKKVKSRMAVLAEDGHVQQNRDFILSTIQHALVKSLARSLIMFLYADYLTGPKFMKSIQDQRLIRIERTLDGFCQFVEKIDGQMDFIGADEQSDIEFRQRFSDTADRQEIKSLFESVHTVLNTIQSGQPLWRVQLSLRALSYKFQNTLSRLMNIEPDEYDVMSEQEYERFI
jgi:hypothetical protein